jgi:hypothetical protein
MGQTWCQHLSEAKQTPIPVTSLSIETPKPITATLTPELIETLKPKHIEPSVKRPLPHTEPLLETSTEFKHHLPMLKTHLQLYFPKVLHPIICDYTYWFVKEGSLVDVQGASELYDIYEPSINRWDLCRVERVIGRCALAVKPIHRPQMFPYNVPSTGFALNPETAYRIDSPQIQPFLSHIGRPEIKHLTTYDLLDVQNEKDGTWKVAIVIAIVTGGPIWVQYPATYTSREHKESLQEWIDFPSERLAQYLTRTCHFK